MYLHLYIEIILQKIKKRNRKTNYFLLYRKNQFFLYNKNIFHRKFLQNFRGRTAGVAWKVIELVYLILEVATHKVWKNHIVSFLTRKQIVRLNS